MFTQEMIENRNFVCESYHSGTGRITRIYNARVRESWMTGEPYVTYSVDIASTNHSTTSRLFGATSTKHEERESTYSLHGVSVHYITDPSALLRYAYPV